VVELQSQYAAGSDVWPIEFVALAENGNNVGNVGLIEDLSEMRVWGDDYRRDIALLHSRGIRGQNQARKQFGRLQWK